MIISMSQVGYLSAQINKAHFDSMMRNCEIYVNHYKPTYIIDKDTFAVARIPMPPDSINNFLFDCIKAKNYAPLKFTYLILDKQLEEYNKVDHQDYDLDGISSDNDGFIQMAWIYLKMDNIPKEDKGLIFTGEMANKLYKKRKDIQGWGKK